MIPRRALAIVAMTAAPVIEEAAIPWLVIGIGAVVLVAVATLSLARRRGSSR